MSTVIIISIRIGVSLHEYWASTHCFCYNKKKTNNFHDPNVSVYITRYSLQSTLTCGVYFYVFTQIVLQWNKFDYIHVLEHEILKCAIPLLSQKQIFIQVL